MSLRVILADDHLVVRAGLRAMLDPLPDIEVVGEAADGDEAVSLARELHPDMVLMDLRMPGLDGVAATARLQDLEPATGVLVLTTFDSDADILRATGAGATGYLLKDAALDELVRAIRSAAAGQSALAPRVASRLMGQVRGPARAGLSLREVEVLELVARGRTNTEVAGTLHVSEATVKTHLLHIFAKLQVDDRTQAVTAALERGVLRLGG